MTTVMSNQICDLAKALTKAQSLIRTAAKDSINPHFKSRYADLASVWEAIRQPLTANNLSIVQTLGNEDLKVKCTTILLHESGQFIQSEFSATPQQNTPQALGSCATYLRRYSLQAMVGVAPDDDDGNEASQKKASHETNFTATTQKIYSNQNNQHAVVKPKTEVAPNVAAHPTFDPKNAAHIKSIGTFLAQKNNLKMFDTLARRLEGKTFTKENVETEWAVIDPERPDKEPV